MSATPASLLLARAQRDASLLVALRRSLHQNPELSFEEHATAERMAREVAALGFEVRRGVARTGVVAELKVGTGEGPVVALRADMDALPLQETNDHDFVSRVPGVMHACGHDAHMTGLVGAARLLTELEGEGALPSGRIRLLFQPSEESMDEGGMSGGRLMAEEGVMEGVNAVVGLHVGAHLPLGQIFVTPGPFFAGNDSIHIVIQGKAAHAARAHEGVDALVLAAQGILAVQQVVSRGIAPERRGVVSLGTIQGGDAPNIVCDRVEIRGTLRYFEPEVREALRAGVTAVFKGLEAQGARVTVHFTDGYPPVVNDPRVLARVEAAAEAVAGAPLISAASEANMTSEDFSFLAEEAPGTFFWLGAALPDPREHHHSRFDIDEAVLPLGAALLAGAAIELLKNPVS
jgi:amidohydrolase